MSENEQRPDVLVVVEGGCADVTVHRPGVRVEVRDFDVEVDEASAPNLWRDEHGDLCSRWTEEGEYDDPRTAAYLRQRGVVCPYCGDSDIEGDSFDHDGGGGVSQEISCKACGRRWADLYELVGFEPIDG